MMPDNIHDYEECQISSDSFYAGKSVYGVSDGVGGWKTFGIDPRDFGYDLIKSACRNIEKWLQNQ